MFPTLWLSSTLLRAFHHYLRIINLLSTKYMSANASEYVIPRKLKNTPAQNLRSVGVHKSLFHKTRLGLHCTFWCRLSVWSNIRDRAVLYPHLQWKWQYILQSHSFDFAKIVMTTQVIMLKSKLLPIEMYHYVLLLLCHAADQIHWFFHFM